MNNGCIMNLFVDCSRVMDNGRLDGLPLNDGLDCFEVRHISIYNVIPFQLTGFVNVMVLMLVNMSSDISTRLFDLASGLLVAVQSPLLLEGLLMFGKHLLLVFTDDGRGSDVNMLGVESLLVLYGLNSVLRYIVR